MTAKKRTEPKREFHVGDKIKVNMHAGKIVDAAVKAVRFKVERKFPISECAYDIRASPRTLEEPKLTHLHLG